MSWFEAKSLKTTKELKPRNRIATFIMARKPVPVPYPFLTTDQKQTYPPSLASTLSGTELNGVFLAVARPALAGEMPDPSMHLVHRRDQLRRVGRDRILQSTSGGRDPRLDREVILGESNLLPFDFLRKGDKIGRAVVKIQRGDGAAGTGFLVAPDILLTNNHVLSDSASAQSAYALANYERMPPDDPTGLPAVARLKPQTLFVTSAELDFTFVAVEGIDFLGAVPIDRDSFNLIENEYVNLIQHPRGRPKEIAVQDNLVVRADSLVAQYSCDTEPGSSGSPVFNNQWRLVALHHASVLADEAHDPQPSTDPSSGQTTNAAARYLNEGIRLSAIAVWLETYEPSNPEERRQIDRLLGIVQGLDPQIGFFGALGHLVDGKSATQIVNESYQGDTAKLDIALWNLRGLEGVIHGRADEIARIIADMRMDIWIFAAADSKDLEGVSQSLKVKFGLDYGFTHGRDPTGRVVTVLHNRARGLGLESIAWPTEVSTAVGCEPPLYLKAIIPWADANSAELRIVPLFWSSWAVAPATDLPWVESIAVQARQSDAVDWLIFGSSASLLAPENLLILSGEKNDHLIVAADEADGAFALMSRATSGVSRVYTSSNLIPTLGHPELLIVAGDRKLPSSITSLGGHAPIAVRLVLNDGKSHGSTASSRKRKKGAKRV